MAQLRQAWARQHGWTAVFWLAAGFLMASQVVAGMAAASTWRSVAGVLLVNVAGFLLLLLATPAILWLARRFPLAGRRDLRNLPIHAAAALGIAVAHLLWYAALEWYFNPRGIGPEYPFRRVLYAVVLLQFHTSVLLYAAIVAIGNALHSIRRLAQREAEAARLATELAQAQLDALRRQLEPHFLFNSLNAIAGLVRENRNHDAVEMIAGLSDLLRRVVEDSGRQLVPLAEEIAFLESYIKLQTMRFGERLKVTVDIPIDLYEALVPPLVLQPLMENAIVHGIARLVEGGEIRISASRAQGMLSIRLYNDGPALAPAGGRAGVGLSNTNGRLATLYGTGSRVELRDSPPRGVETTLQLPFRTAA